MEKTITPKQIRKNNRNLIYDYIYKERTVSQQDIAYALHLSRPTIASNLSDLEAAGLICKNGLIETEQIGRKASAYSIVSDFRIAIGVEILSEEIKLIAVNLYGEQILRFAMPLTFSKEESYFQAVSKQINDFIDQVKTSNEQILGVGIAMQGLVSPDGKSMTYGKIIDSTGLKVNVFSRYIPDYPCKFIHDADGAAIAEIWASPDLDNAFYFSVSNHFGAAMIMNHKVYKGKHGHSATIEHLQIDPAGRRCYCGKRGCVETVCSLNSLLDGMDIDDFFTKVRGGDPESMRRWNAYLINLARVIYDVHLTCDVDYILGGYLAPYFRDEDIDFLYKQVASLTPFEEATDYISLSKMPKHNICIGAALPYISSFLDNFN